MKRLLLLTIVLFLIRDLPAGEVDLADVRAHGNMAELVGVGEDVGAAGDTRRRWLASLPRDDSGDWWIIVFTTPNCAACKTLLQDFDDHADLAALKDWGKFVQFDTSQKSQRFRFENYKIDRFPTLVVVPPANSKKYPFCYVVRKTGYDGRPGDLAEHLCDCIYGFADAVAASRSVESDGPVEAIAAPPSEREAEASDAAESLEGEDVGLRRPLLPWNRPRPSPAPCPCPPDQTEPVLRPNRPLRPDRAPDRLDDLPFKRPKVRGGLLSGLTTGFGKIFGAGLALLVLVPIALVVLIVFAIVLGSFFKMAVLKAPKIAAWICGLWNKSTPAGVATAAVVGGGLSVVEALRDGLAAADATEQKAAAQRSALLDQAARYGEQRAADAAKEQQILAEILGKKKGK